MTKCFHHVYRSYSIVESPSRLALSGSGSARTMAFTQASWGHLLPSLPRISRWDNLQPGEASEKTRGATCPNFRPFFEIQIGYGLWKCTFVTFCETSELVGHLPSSFDNLSFFASFFGMKQYQERQVGAPHGTALQLTKLEIS